jgi:GntR family transcriptional regulator/MocR family aminotransferase
MSRTSSPPELRLALDRRAAVPLRAQLERELRAAIRTGRLRPGVQLPSTRGLARDLGLSRGLVVEAYDQLRAEGYLTAHQGSVTLGYGVVAEHQITAGIERLAAVIAGLTR